MALKRLEKYFAITFAFSFLFSCAGVAERTGGKINSLGFTDISEGLPRDGQWRQNIALADMDGDGHLDIVVPPPRKATEGQNMPHIFLRDKDKWKEGVFTFPPLPDYGYGGIAAADINRDGYPDIVLATQQGKIILLENNKKNGFAEKPFIVNEPFNSRTVAVSDVNGDGWPDIIALSESPFSANSYRPRGILVGINREGKGWDVKIAEGGDRMFGDSMAVGDLKGSGRKDIIIAPLIGAKKEDMKLVWFGDGKGNFSVYDGRIIGVDVMPFFVRAGDLDGDGKDEVVFRVSGFGAGAKVFLAAYKWDGAGFADISKGLEAVQRPIVFDLADVDGDGKKELIVLSEDGIHIYKYSDKKWTERGYYQLSSAETAGAYDLEAGRNRDGSLLIVYNLGQEGEAFQRGIRAFLMK